MTAHLIADESTVVHATEQHSGKVHTNNGHPVVGTLSEAFGTLAATEAADVVAITGLVGRSGALAATEGVDTAAFVGTVTAAGITGIMAAIETADVFAASGMVAAADERIGILAATEDADSALIAGIVILPAIIGTLAASEASDLAAFNEAATIVGGIYFAPRRLEIIDGYADGAVIIVTLDVVAGRATGSSHSIRQSIIVGLRCVDGVVAGGAMVEGSMQLADIVLRSGGADGEINISEHELLILAEAA